MECTFYDHNFILYNFYIFFYRFQKNASLAIYKNQELIGQTELE